MNLQIALILIGSIIVLGIYFYSRWQSPTTPRDSAQRREPLADSQGKARSRMHTEPSFGGSAEDLTAYGHHADIDYMANMAEQHEQALDEDHVEEAYQDEEAQLSQPDDNVDDRSADSVGMSKVVADSDTHDAVESDHAPESDLMPDDDPGAMAEDARTRQQNRVEVADSPGSPRPHADGPQFEEEDIPLLDSRVDGEPHEQPFAPPIAGDPIDEQVARDNDSEQEYDLLDDKPSLRDFIGSMNPIQKLRGTLQEKLDAVKAEREGTEPPRRPAERETEDDSGGSRELEKNPEPKKKWWSSARQDRPETRETTRRSASFRFDAEPHSSVGAESGASAPGRDGPAFADSAFEDSTGSELEQQVEVPGSLAAGQDQDSIVEPDRLEIQPAEGFEKLSQIDYYVKLSGDRDVSRESVLAIYREGAGGLSKTHSIYGMRLPDKVWCDLEHESEETRFGDLVITIQLVDQDGPVTEHDMTRFSSLVMKLSESTGRGFAFMAPIENAHQQALAIEQFRNRFDSIFLINVRPLEEEMFEGPVIDRCATQIGLTADENGFYTRYKPVGKQKVCLYSLANLSDTGEFDMENMRAERTRGVTFFTRPAVNRSPGAVFSEMVDAARAFASRIKGEAVTPGYEDLSSEDIDAIRRSIEAVATEMESYGINPGSEEANRLF